MGKIWITRIKLNVYYKEALKKFIGAILLGGIGFWLSFSERRPFEALPSEVVEIGKYICVMVSFQWESIPIVVGCVLITLGLAVLFEVFSSLRIQRKSKALQLHRSIVFYEKALLSFLVVLLYFTCLQEGFIGLVRIYFSVSWKHIPVTELMSVLHWSVLELLLMVALETVWILVFSTIPKKIYDYTAVGTIVVGVLAILCSTITNLWYFLLCLICMLFCKWCMQLMFRSRET